MREENGSPSLEKTSQIKRHLFYFPIVHSVQDMGSLASHVKEKHKAKDNRNHMESIARFWDLVEDEALSLVPCKSTVRIYQDALPVCDHEQQIVNDLVKQGSRNHAIVLHLMEKGAQVMGTESPDLLLEEYHLAKRVMEQGGQSITDEKAAIEILHKRDQFIAERINNTLAAGEVGIVFLGMMHCIETELSSDIEIIYPIGRPEASQGTAK
ncbi:hypothetical protein KCM76_02150 [Zooshikella marina]|uniref:hypothetical protein n=1 Tax=Zooshikella ganghwensis TaxID=202772 RepID=UPI001BAF1310|nr:hypothetical protein [Zooshikella ganghwensis]MBU2704763.1 hypothetical protein [Zooshikella ganghwensis]